MQTQKSKCKCKKCGAAYTLFVDEHWISKYTYTLNFTIIDDARPEKNKSGIAVSHC